MELDAIQSRNFSYTKKGGQKNSFSKNKKNINCEYCGRQGHVKYKCIKRKNNIATLDSNQQGSRFNSNSAASLNVIQASSEQQSSDYGGMGSLVPTDNNNEVNKSNYSSRYLDSGPCLLVNSDTNDEDKIAVDGTDVSEASNLTAVAALVTGDSVSSRHVLLI